VQNLLPPHLESALTSAATAAAELTHNTSTTAATAGSRQSSHIIRRSSNEVSD
jgi:hypothetical protein